MGSDVSVVGNHSLNTTDLKAMAEDIVSRLDINIQYAYSGRKEHFMLLGENGDDGEVILGEIIKDNTFKSFKLIDEEYQAKQLYKKFGDDLFLNPDYWNSPDGKIPSLRWIEEKKSNIIFSCYDLTSTTDYDYLLIYNESFHNGIVDFPRYGEFCNIFRDFFTDCRYPPHLYFKDSNFQYINSFRKELMAYSFPLGGNKVYYFNDQSSVLKGVGQGEEALFSWKELEAFVAETTMPFLLDIPKFMSDPHYRIDFYEMKEEPLSFVDDFSDLLA